MTEESTEATETTETTQETTTDSTTETTQETAQETTQETAQAVTELPENWRSLMAGDNEKGLKLLGRYNTPSEALQGMQDFQTKARNGEKIELPENPTDEDKAQWREDNGIPATPADYELSLDEGLIPGEADKPILDHYITAMHAENATPEQVNAGVNAYYQMEAQAQLDRETQDKSDATNAIDTLRDAWGNDYRSNENAVHSYMSLMPEGLRENMASARLADGTCLMNSPEMLAFMSDQSRKLNPAATVVPNSKDPVADVQTRKGELQAMMANRNSPYNRGPQKAALRQEYRELIDAETALSKQGR